MNWLFFSISIIILGIIAYQDFKLLAVSWILFPLLAISLGLVHFSFIDIKSFYWSVGINFLVVSVVLLVLYIYALIKLKQSFSTVFGLGDILFFYAFAMGFPSVTFLVLFVFSIFFSLVLHLLLSRNTEEKHR